ncbi:regulator of G-protein signaling 17 [Fopius arisanus]|uniref:Regulator of G-protein signaling 17 n=1 Tax=Fopius arisanus TaxID=64838 RepID=A0A9R1TTH0_9HYME|nr:PREDICTED: regulator of G-protein signaling 17 [Fopius arisanus]
MLEMPSGLGATAMGIGVSHGGSGAESGCRLRTSSQGQASQQQASNQGSTTGGQQSEQQQQSSQDVQPQQQVKQEQSQQQQRVGHGGRSKKDNCCLCWCCCCSCSNKCLAAVGTGNGGSGGGGESGKKRGNSGVASGDIVTSDHGGDMTVSSAGNGLDGLDGLDSTPECCGLEEVRSWGTSFDKLMRSGAGRKLFREFLKSEYSEENIAFWLACEQLKRESNPEKIEEKARYIYEDYISILSPKEVSLDSRVREIVNRNMVEPTPHTFDEAQLQIYTLMHRDSYPRFVNSDIFRRVARLGSGPPSPTNAESDHGPPSGKSKSKKSVT